MNGLISAMSVGIFLILIPALGGLSVPCMVAYEEGGVPAVFESAECSYLVQSSTSLKNQTMNCQFATLQGHREYQEDRILCNLDMKIPLLGANKHTPVLLSFKFDTEFITGRDGLKEMTIGLMAIFDGHGGKEASEMAAHLFQDYFYLHAVFNLFKAIDYESESIVLETLKEALLRAIHDIDVKFSQEALQNKNLAGSTATVALMVNGKILISNVGDSRALICSEKIQTGGEEAVVISPSLLTKDHHPDRDDEKARIEATGGSVIVWDVPRVNGVLALSRSIGDVYLKRYGVIAVPEITHWLPLNATDKFLVLSSDGIFESLTTKDVCHLVWDPHVCSSSASLAECVLNAALKRGSMDNLSVIILPL